MRLVVANGIMSRLQTAIHDAWPADNKPRTSQNALRNGYTMSFDRGYLLMDRHADNSLMLQIHVPNNVGTRYEAKSSYFENANYAHGSHLCHAISFEDEEAELISHAVALMSLVIAPDREP